MCRQSADDITSVHALGYHIVKQKHEVSAFVRESHVDHLEVELHIHEVEVTDDFLQGDVTLAEAGSLVEDGEGVAHSAVSLLGNHLQGLLLVCISLTLGHHLQVVDSVGDCHTVEIVYLAT